MKKSTVLLLAVMAVPSVIMAQNTGQPPVPLGGAGTVSGTATGGFAAGGATASGNTNPGGSAFQRSSSSSRNMTSGGAFTNGSGGHNLNMGSRLESRGSTRSMSRGTQSGSGFGETGTGAVQGGGGVAFTRGGAVDSAATHNADAMGEGSATTSGLVIQGSFTATENVDNGNARGNSSGMAKSINSAGIHIDADVHPATVEVEQNTNTRVLAGGRANTNVSGNGVANAAGGGLSLGNATTYAIASTLNDGTLPPMNNTPQ